MGNFTGDLIPWGNIIIRDRPKETLPWRNHSKGVNPGGNYLVSIFPGGNRSTVNFSGGNILKGLPRAKHSRRKHLVRTILG
jgi:hypothetical protein